MKKNELMGKNQMCNDFSVKRKGGQLYTAGEGSLFDRRKYRIGSTFYFKKTMRVLTF